MPPHRAESQWVLQALGDSFKEVSMSNVQKCIPIVRRPYRLPSIDSYTEQEILAAIGPAQGYGTMPTMPLEHGASHGS
jgi:hypothetical protein